MAVPATHNTDEAERECWLQLVAICKYRTSQGEQGEVATSRRASEIRLNEQSPPPQENAPPQKDSGSRGGRVLRTLGLGLITGAADDDPSAIGTYASAGATIGPAFLWTAPVTFPMMCAVVYLSAKLGQVSGKGLFHVIRDNYPRWICIRR
jgi:hypothetical protein